MTTSPTWLQLLLDDSGVDGLDRHRQALLDSGLDPQEVESEARRVLQLQAQLRERAQRAAELTVLSEVAARLTSVRDLPELLSDIAVHARQLLRTDVAYLALVEDDGLRIRFFEGMSGAASRDIRLSMTAGLAGRIVTTGKAAWTSDYLGDPTIVHQAEADELAGDEQLRSILGVPLRARGTTLGVLFAAERSHRPFLDSEVSLLAGLASHAAIAIENARLFDAERASSVESRAANEQLRASAAAVDRAIVLHDRLMEAVVRGGGPTEVVQALALVLEVPVQLIDSADHSLAGPDLVSSHVAGPSPATLFVTSDRRTLVVYDHDDDGGTLLCPVVAAEAYLGCLVVRTSGPIDDAEVRLLERGAMGIALTLVQQRALDNAMARSRSDLLTALIDGGEPEVLERRAAAAHVDLSKPHVLALVESDDPASRNASVDMARQHEGLVVDRAGRTLLLVPNTVDLQPLAAHATVGLSPPVCGAAALPEAYEAARLCLRALAALGKHRIVANSEALGVYRFLLGPGGRDEAAEFVRRTVGPLLDYDRARGTDLAPTLEEYLASGRQHTATAAALCIHPNTLYQRLTRIDAVLGEDWRERDSAFDLHVALRLHRLAEAL